MTSQMVLIICIQKLYFCTATSNHLMFWLKVILRYANYVILVLVNPLMKMDFWTWWKNRLLDMLVSIFEQTLIQWQLKLIAYFYNIFKELIYGLLLKSLLTNLLSVLKQIYLVLVLSFMKWLHYNHLIHSTWMWVLLLKIVLVNQ